jgi:Skp family chaperone for outer membrane proteins
MMISTQLRTTIFTLLFVAFAGSAFANVPAGLKLAVVDFQKALNSVEEGKAAKARLEKEFATKKKELETKETQIQKLQTELEDLQKKVQSGLLKPEETPAIMARGRKVEEDLRKLIEENLEMRRKHQEDLGQKEMKATQEILNRLRQIAQNIGRTESYNLILEQNSSGLVYASTYTDITEKMIQQYNSQYKAK